ncbi:MAG TPA: GNAT family N-acetyltransferase [Armatimonadota bacterium]|jgi:phosphinothricin acetyltransferase
MGLLIRRATLADLPAVLAIYNHAIRTSPSTFDIDEKTLQEREAWFAAHDARHPILVAEDAGGIVGWGTLSPMSTRAGWSRTVEDSLYVRADAIGRGIGTALLRALLDEGRRIGHHVVIAQITAGNAASVALHRRCGFVDVGVAHEVGWKFGRWYDLIIMECLLSTEERELR